MARSGPKSSGAKRAPASSKGGRGANSEATREKLLDAAIATLVDDGYSGASARAISGRAGCNQAVIYYHFGSVDDLLSQAVNRSGRTRLARYREVMDDLTDPTEIITAWHDLHREDIEIGHVPALVELLGGVASSETLREGLSEAVQPSMEFITETIDRVVKAAGLDGVVPVEAAADAVFSLFLGVEMLTHVDGDTERPDKLFAAGQGFANQAAPLLALFGSIAKPSNN